MKPLLIVLCAFVVLAPLPLRAQLNCVTPKGNESFLFEGTFTDSVLLSKAKSQEAQWIVCVWLTGSGGTEYSIDAESVSSAAGNLDSMTAAEVFSEVAAHVVTRGVTLGYTLCPASGSVSVGVTFAAGVERTSTGFRVCGSGLTRSTFSCASLAGTIAVLQTGCSGGGCASGCEPTSATTLLQ